MTYCIYFHRTVWKEILTATRAVIFQNHRWYGYFKNNMDKLFLILRISIFTSRCTASWPLRHATLPDYRQISQKRSISAAEMYSTICIVWAGDKFWSWFDVNQYILDEGMSRNEFHIFVRCSYLDLWPFRPQVCSPVTLDQRYMFPLN